MSHYRDSLGRIKWLRYKFLSQGKISDVHIWCARKFTPINLTLYSPMEFPIKLPGCVVQSVTCLATDACLTEDPVVASSIPVRSQTFVEIDHEMISTVILFACSSLPRKKCG